MQQLVVRYRIGDRFTWWATNTIPIYAKSAEHAIEEFHQAFVKQVKIYDSDALAPEFIVFGTTFDVDEIHENGYPEFMKVDEWFSIYAKNK